MECANPMDSRCCPERLLVFDRHPGRARDIGVLAQARHVFAESLQPSIEMFSTGECSTDDGCLCCVQTELQCEYNVAINKRAAVIIVEGVIQAEDAYRETRGFLNIMNSQTSHTWWGYDPPFYCGTFEQNNSFPSD